MTAEPIRIPVEITAPPPVFDLVARGYDRAQVDEHLLTVEQENAELTWQRDFLQARAEEVERERERIAEERAEWEAERDDWEPTYAKLGDRARQILTMSQQEAVALMEATRRECEERRAADEAEAAEAREAVEKEIAEARARLRRELDLARREAEAQARRIVHEARQQATELTDRGRREAEAIRIRALEYLAGARQERSKAAAMLADLARRLGTVAERMAEQDGDDGTPRRVVVLDADSELAGPDALQV